MRSNWDPGRSFDRSLSSNGDEDEFKPVDVISYLMVPCSQCTGENCGKCDVGECVTDSTICGEFGLCSSTRSGS